MGNDGFGRDALGLLAATAPYAALAEKLALYGWLVGSWEIESTWYGQDGAERTGSGEWHFSWILGGRGIQDVLFASGSSPDKFGTTIRCYDEAIDAWRIVWMQPAGGEFASLIGRRSGEAIVQEGDGKEPGTRIRWSFLDIEPVSFTWRGEKLRDGLWVTEQEMKATKRLERRADDTKERV